MNLRKIKNWLRENDFECTVKKDPYFSYSTIEDCIFISDEFNECDHLDAYMMYIKSLGYNDTLHPKTVAFLHELGHAETMDDLPEIDYILDKIKNIVETPSPNMFILNIKANVYYRLPIERKATEWALNYIKNNYDEVHELDQLII